MSFRDARAQTRKSGSHRTKFRARVFDALRDDDD
jgi:hypothetical protein